MIKLYSFRRCPFAIRVRVTLYEKQIPFTVIEEDLKNFSSDLKAMHPEAKVPVLVHEVGSRRHVIYESSVITEYLEDAFPEPRLLPSDPVQRMEFRLLTYWCNQIFKPDVDRFKYGTSRFPEDECEGVSLRLENHLKKLESLLDDSHWLAGDDFTLSDIHVFPFYRQLTRSDGAGPLIEEFPKLNKWLENATSRKSFTQAMAKSK